MRFHQLLGHPSMQTTRATAKQMRITLTGKLEECSDCILAMMRRKNIPKLSENKSNIIGERLCIDVSYIKKDSMGNNKYWLIIEDQFSGFRWSFFMRRKTEAAEFVKKFIEEGRFKNKSLGTFIRMDNAGENQSIESLLKKTEIDSKIEFTSPHTPEQNGKVERSFATLWGRTRSILNNAGLEESMREKMWVECAATATILSNLMAKRNGKSANEIIMERNLPIVII